jgi:hypothetical protein
MKKLSTLLIISIFLINACGPTLESSNDNWKDNQAAMVQLKSEFSVFAPLIDQKLEEAKKVWNAAQSISDEEKKLDKMVEANNILSSGAIGNLRNMKREISKLKSEKEGLMKLNANSYQLEEKATNATRTVKEAIANAEKVLYMNADEFTINDAPGKLNRAFNGLNDAYKEVEIVIDLINDANNKVEQEKKDKEQEIQAEKDKEEKAKADIKCGYCGAMNKAGSTKCSSCGAPLDKK